MDHEKGKLIQNWLRTEAGVGFIFTKLPTSFCFYIIFNKTFGSGWGNGVVSQRQFDKQIFSNESASFSLLVPS